MIREIVRDTIFLSQKSEPAGKDDLSSAEDLLDTLKAHSEQCVGMAANMIGVKKTIIAINDCGRYTVMLNPEIVKFSEPYEAEEGCLSLDGTRKAKRYNKIKVRYQNEALEAHFKTYTGFTAEIIQHEIDHLSGILI
ncbi:MAG: peptide deformylase [Eubacteriales bacterium]|nr:peptide deformylase [Eubacteriales bacterium]MDD3883129.1 peptide deformylase [Eubacteriales bacterium]MDD4512701.1 peptide deformylase [Eubacteriales bacterium]